MIWQLVAVAVWAVSVALLCRWVSRGGFDRSTVIRRQQIESAKRRHPSARP